MRVLVATDAHIYQTPDGKYWCSSIYGYSFWTRYLEVFESVKIVARVKKVDALEGRMLEVDGPGVEIFGIPFYRGPKQLFKQFFKIQRVLKDVSYDCDVAIFRMPSQTAQMTYSHIKKNMVVGGEIVYDPYDDLKNKNSLFLNIINRLISSRLKKFCSRANGVSYVTKYSIQKHYPSKASQLNGNSKTYFETYYSSINLSKSAFSGPREFTNKKKLRLVMSSVAMNSERKGERVFLQVIKKLKESGYTVSGVLIGDGPKRKEFEEFSKELGIREEITFTGLLPSADDIRKVLLNSDLFLFPTQAEGLPRGIIEAMASGMPVLSTPVGGIPELIEEKYLFNPDDVDGFSNMLIHLFNNKNELNDMSFENYNKSKEYSNEQLQKRRNKFYRDLAELAK